MTTPIDVTALLAELLQLGEKPPIAAVETQLRILARMVALADPLTCLAVRSAVLDTLVTLKVRGAAGLVDAALGLAREAKRGGQGRSFDFEAIEPWPAAVDGAALLDEIVTLTTRFVVMREVVADTLALLIVHTHAHEAADISPIAVITSPTKRCGKTTLLRLVLALVPRPLATSNISPAAIFRTIEAHGPTVVIDEADTFMKLNEETRGLLNAGHTRDLAYVIRSVGDDHEPRKFTTWAPKFLGLIGRLPDTVEDRAIVLPLTRAKKTDPVEKLRKRRPRDMVDTLPARLVRWAGDHLEKLRAHDAAIPETLNDREADNWAPLFAIAELAGGDWPERATKAALALSGQVDPEEEEAGEAALHDVGALLRQAKRDGDGRLSSADVVDKLTAEKTSRWAAYRDDRPVSPRQLARLLGRFGIKPKPIRQGQAVFKGYDLADFEDLLSRYPPPGAVTSVTPASDKDDRQESIRYTGPGVADPKSGSDPHEHRGVTDVTDPQGGMSGGDEEEIPF